MSKLVFFTNISHEFRTPLTLISSPLERLSQNENNDEKLQLLAIIRKNSERLLHLINQILDLRKLDMSQMKVNAKQATGDSLREQTSQPVSRSITEKESWKMRLQIKSAMADLIETSTDYANIIREINNWKILKEIMFAPHQLKQQTNRARVLQQVLSQ